MHDIGLSCHTAAVFSVQRATSGLVLWLLLPSLSSVSPSIFLPRLDHDILDDEGGSA